MTGAPSSTFAICVYCGSSNGHNPAHADLAARTGALLANKKVRMIYGAGSIGLMGVAARACLEKGGQVTGIIPEHLDAVEITQEGLDETIVTSSMHDRKHLMFNKSDAFVVLPGGLGTMDEFFEILTWAQLGLHKKPIILMNQTGYFTPLASLIDHVIAEGFANENNRQFFTFAQTMQDVILQIDYYLKT